MSTLPAAELALSWRAFEVTGPIPWHAALRVAGAVLTLSRAELLRLCAATELDRVWPADVRRLLEAQRTGRALTWAAFVDGARGLTPAKAPGAMTLGEVLERIGAEGLAIETTVRRERSAA